MTRTNRSTKVAESQAVVDRDYLLQLMIQHERAIAQLYGLYAKELEEGSFWRQLQREEELHASLLQDLATAVHAGKAVFKINRIGIHGLQTSLASLRQRFSLWKASGLDPKDAFCYAMLLEDSLVENHFFAVAPEDSPFTKEILQTLQQATGHHARRIRHMGRKYLSKYAWFWRAMEKIENFTAA